MRYLLDTNICIYIIKKKPPVVLKRVESKQPGEIAISTITLAELEYGIARSRYPDRNRVALLEFLIPFTILDFDQAAQWSTAIFDHHWRPEEYRLARWTFCWRHRQAHTAWFS